jgi:hypothetical protein
MTSPGGWVDDMADNRHQVPSAVDFDFNDSVTVFFVEVGYSLNLALDGGEVVGGHLKGYKITGGGPIVFNPLNKLMFFN